MVNFIFLHPWWFCAAIPLALLLMLGRNASSSRLIASHLAQAIGARSDHSNVIIYSFSIAWILAVIALAGPSWRTVDVPNYQKSNARVLVMDMSKSMYATDISPNRLTQERFKALDLLDLWKEGKTGLVAYADNGYMLSPLTEDSQTIKEAVRNIQPELMPAPGSNAVAGVKQAIDLLKHSGINSGEIVILTDGIDATSKQALTSNHNQADQIIKLANCSEISCQWRISILAIATVNGAPALLSDGQLLQKEGTPIVAKLELAPLIKMTEKTGGTLRQISADNSDIKSIVSQTKLLEVKLEKSEQSHSKQRHNDGYWLLFPLLLLVSLAFRKGVLLQLVGITFVFSSLFIIAPSHAAVSDATDTINASPLSSVHSSVPASVSTSPWLNQQQLGAMAYEQKQYPQAIEHYKMALHQKGTTASQEQAIQSALGASYYKNNQYKQSIETLKPVADKNIEAQYNLANAYAKDGQLQQALETYDKVLKTQPHFEQAAFNQDLVKKALEQQKQQQKQQKEDKQNQNEDQKDNKGDHKDKQNQSNDQPQTKKKPPQPPQKQSDKQAQQNSDAKREQKSNTDATQHQKDQPPQQSNAQQPKEQKNGAPQKDQQKQDQQSQQPQGQGQQDQKNQDQQSQSEQATKNDPNNTDKAPKNETSGQQKNKGDQSDQDKEKKKSGGLFTKDQKSADQQKKLTDQEAQASIKVQTTQQKDETYQILEQIPIDKGALLKAQMLLEARQRANQNSGAQ